MFAYDTSQLCQEDYISYIRLHALTFYFKFDNNFILIIITSGNTVSTRIFVLYSIRYTVCNVYVF